jgi:FAD binding domain/Cytokinin dehydrogenase 1, FAD and cytokinin binding
MTLNRIGSVAGGSVLLMRDFGGCGPTVPREVVRPSSAREVAAALLRAGERTPVVPRGCGHSTDGRSLTDGVSIDMRALSTIHEVRYGSTRVDAGATWREVLEATLPHGLTPPVLTDHLDLTVGGTLSAGGVGGTSHVHGTQAGNVTELEVVTPDGEIVRCSASHNRWLFDSVRGRRGHGVITRAVLRLVPAPHHVLSCTVPCEDAAGLLRVQTGTRAEHLSGQARPSETGWRYEAKAVLFDGKEPPPGIEPSKIETLTYREFTDRMRPDVDELIELGEWARPHPWAMAFLPGSTAAAFVRSTLAATGPEDMGLSGVVLIKALKVTEDPGVPGLRDVADPVLFGLLRTASPGCASPAAMATANADFHARASEAGGLRYPL